MRRWIRVASAVTLACKGVSSPDGGVDAGTGAGPLPPIVSTGVGEVIGTRAGRVTAFAAGTRSADEWPLNEADRDVHLVFDRTVETGASDAEACAIFDATGVTP